MATLTFTLSQANLDKVIDAYGQSYESMIWSPSGRIANPETKAQFARRMLLEEIQKKVRGYERSEIERTIPEPPIIPIT